jgi:hypothetical protein
MLPLMRGPGNFVTPLRHTRGMNTQTEQSPTFSATVDRANAIHGVVALYRLADAFRASGPSDLADGCEAMLDEIVRCINKGWKNRKGQAIERFDVTVDLEPGPKMWGFHATMLPVLR